MSRAYIIGALHDATEREYTYRLSQKEREYVEFIANLVRKLGYKAWTYKEGKDRQLYVVEFSKKALDGFEIKTDEDKRDYIRGYFDAEGSVPNDKKTRFYIYFCQNNKKDLEEVKGFLKSFGIVCGKTHRPSVIKPNFWRFYVRANSHKKFVEEIYSWHPRKSQLLRTMI